MDKNYKGFNTFLEPFLYVINPSHYATDIRGLIISLLTNN
jgi:hypothetical protein